jgi:hypothetical protein
MRKYNAMNVAPDINHRYTTLIPLYGVVQLFESM